MAHDRYDTSTARLTSLHPYAVASTALGERPRAARRARAGRGRAGRRAWTAVAALVGRVAGPRALRPTRRHADPRAVLPAPPTPEIGG